MSELRRQRSVLERYAKKPHHNGAQRVLIKLNDAVYDQLTRTEMIRLIGIDHVYPAEPEFFAATRRAVRDAQKQSGAPDSSAGATS